MLSPCVGHGQVQERGKPGQLTCTLTSHVTNNLQDLLVLKITYLDLSFNSETGIFTDGSCKSEVYSCSEATSNGEN